MGGTFQHNWRLPTLVVKKHTSSSAVRSLLRFFSRRSFLWLLCFILEDVLTLYRGGSITLYCFALWRSPPNANLKSMPLVFWTMSWDKPNTHRFTSHWEYTSDYYKSLLQQNVTRQLEYITSGRACRRGAHVLFATSTASVSVFVCPFPVWDFCFLPRVLCTLHIYKDTVRANTREKWE